MWDGDFMLTAAPEDLAAIDTPILVLKGDDVYHPTSTSVTVAERAPNATLVDEWKEGAALEAAGATIADFLAAHTP